MPVARYFLFVGGVLLALLFVIDAIVPQDTVAASAIASAPGFDKSMVRIRSAQKLPERVVYDTNLPTIVPPQANVMASAAPVAAQARVRDTFAQFVPAEPAAARTDGKTQSASRPIVAEATIPAAAPQAVSAPKKRKVAKTHVNPPTQLQPRYAQTPAPQPFRVAQQQPHFSLFSGFGTW